jgi:hypothetical protein
MKCPKCGEDANYITGGIFTEHLDLEGERCTGRLPSKETLDQEKKSEYTFAPREDGPGVWRYKHDPTLIPPSHKQPR